MITAGRVLHKEFSLKAPGHGVQNENVYLRPHAR